MHRDLLCRVNAYKEFRKKGIEKTETKNGSISFVRI